MDGEHVRALLASEADIELIEREAQSAQDAGIEGVPYFVFGGIVAVSGARPPEHLAAAITQAADELSRGVAAE